MVASTSAFAEKSIPTIAKTASPPRGRPGRETAKPRSNVS